MCVNREIRSSSQEQGHTPCHDASSTAAEERCGDG
jgi:hypothetical protein